MDEKSAERATEPMLFASDLAGRLRAILDWADLAMSNPDEFNLHGVRNLSGPVFDNARAVLEAYDRIMKPVLWIDAAHGRVPVPGPGSGDQTSIAGSSHGATTRK